jgi:hypothetical protein
VLGVVSGLDSLAGFLMPPIVTGVLGAFGVAPAAAIIAGMVTVALALGVIQTRRAGQAAPSLSATPAE